MIDLVQNENTFFCYTAIYRVNSIIHSIVEMDLNDHQYTGMVWSLVREWMRSDNNKSNQPLLVLLVCRLLTSDCTTNCHCFRQFVFAPLLRNKIALSKQTIPVISGSSGFYNLQIFIPILGNLFFCNL